MELKKATLRIRCEMGACKNMADYTVHLKRVGIRSRLHICSQCLAELYGEIGKTVIPKSLETASKAKRSVK